MSGLEPSRASMALATALLLPLLLSGCQLLDDLILKLPKPPRPLPTGVCDSSSLSEETIDPLTLGEWAIHLPAEATFRAQRYVVPVPARAVAVAEAFPHGPDSFQNRYPSVRQYHGFDCDGLLGIVWTSAEVDDVLLTLFDPDSATHASYGLPSGGETLVAAAYGDGHLYYLTLERGVDAPERTAGLTLHRYALFPVTGEPHASNRLDSSRDGLNVVVSDQPWVGHASMRVMGDLIAVQMGRLMHRGGDGLNHQGGLAAILGTASLDLIQHWSQSSHSFGNLMTIAQSGEFLALDLGDNYPRGVHLHRFHATSRFHRVVYTVKTRHGTSPQNPAGQTFPVFEEISDESTTYYRWSNDNNTYAELGAVVELPEGYAVLFVGEPDEQGNALDHRRARDFLVDARNIGLVLLSRDFDGAPHGAPNFLTDDVVLSHGEGSVTEQGGFYAFNGSWQIQRNTGLRWLTEHRDPDVGNVSRLQAFAVGADAILLLWERWGRTHYQDSWFMVVDGHGGVLSPARVLDGSLPLRLSRTDDPVTIAGQTYLLSGQGEELWIEALTVGP